MSGSAGLFNKQIFFLPRREPKGGRSGRWETHKNYGHPYQHKTQNEQEHLNLAEDGPAGHHVQTVYFEG